MTTIIETIAALRESLDQQATALGHSVYDPRTGNGGYNQAPIRKVVGEFYLTGQEDVPTVDALRQLTRDLMLDPKVSGITKLEVLGCMVRNDAIVPTPEEMPDYTEWFVEYARNRQGGFLDWSLKIPRYLHSQKPVYEHIAEGFEAAYQGVLDKALWDDVGERNIEIAIRILDTTTTKPYGNAQGPAGGTELQEVREVV